jgi:FAD/FMN-containing dehydrogenase
VEEHLAQVAAIVGADHVSTEAAAGFAADESFAAALAPLAVAAPGSSDEVRRLVVWANETATPLVPVSSRRPHFHGDTVPGAPGAVVVDLTRLDGILRIDRRNRVVVIEPGVTYPQLQAALAAQGMRVTQPLAPRAGKSVVASLLERQPTLIPRYNYHLPEPLRSCGVVWGNGRTLFTGEAGGGPADLEAQWTKGFVQVEPKGPAQTDFFRLLTGAQGTMGIVTWAAVKCEIVPAAHKLLAAPAARLDELLDFAYRVLRLRLGDEVLIVNAAYLARLLRGTGVAADAATLPAWSLLLGLGGREHYAAERVAVAERDAHELARGFGLALQDELGGAAGDELTRALYACTETPWKLHAMGAAADIFFLTTLERAPGYLATMQAEATAHGYPLEELGVLVQPQHQGLSHHAEFSLPYDRADAAQAARARELFDHASQRLVADGAYFSRPYGSWAEPVYERDPVSADALRRVKRIFDPAGIMNPGKLCFGALAAKEA